MSDRQGGVAFGRATCAGATNAPYGAACTAGPSQFDGAHLRPGGAEHAGTAGLLELMNLAALA